MDVLFEAILRCEPGREAAAPNSLLMCTDGFLDILVTNPTSQSVSLTSRDKLGTVIPVEPHNVVATTSLLPVTESPYHGTDLPWEEFNFGPHMSSEQKETLHSLLQEFRHVTALSSDNLGHTTLTSHIIDTGITLPIR